MPEPIEIDVPTLQPTGKGGSREARRLLLLPQPAHDPAQKRGRTPADIDRMAQAEAKRARRRRKRLRVITHSNKR